MHTYTSLYEQNNDHIQKMCKVYFWSSFKGSQLIIYCIELKWKVQFGIHL